MTNPSKELYWDDYVVGRSWEFGTYEMRQDEIVAFARQFDPHPFHLDPEQGKAVPSGYSAPRAHTRSARRTACSATGYCFEVASMPVADWTMSSCAARACPATCSRSRSRS